MDKVNANDQIAQLLKRPANETEKRLVAAEVKHKLAIQAIGAIRTAMNIHRPFYEVMAASEHAMMDAAGGRTDAVRDVLKNKSFQIQARMARALLVCLDELNAAANEAIELAEKELKSNG